MEYSNLRRQAAYMKKSLFDQVGLHLALNPYNVAKIQEEQMSYIMFVFLETLPLPFPFISVYIVSLSLLKKKKKMSTLEISY